MKKMSFPKILFRKSGSSTFFRLYPCIFTLRIPELVTQKYQASHRDQLQQLVDKLEEEVGIANALKNHGAPANTSAGTAATQQASARTNASPNWAGTPPWNVRKRLNLTAISKLDFGNQHLTLN